MNYEQFKIMSFAHWDLYLHENQFPYIGRCYTASKRSDATLIIDISKEESSELMHTIIPLWHKTIQELYGECRPNFAIFGNEWNHLHAHLIPRHQTPKQFYNIQFLDPNPEGNYSPYPKKGLSLDILLDIKENIKTTMND